jgi:hypothetical protein
METLAPRPRSAVPVVRFAVLLVLAALLVVTVIVAVETAAVVVFPVFPLLKLGLAAVPWWYLPSRFIHTRTLGPIVPVPAGRNAHQAARNLAPVGHDPTAPMVVRAVPRPARAVPVPAVHEEDLLLIFRHNLYARADFDQNGCGFEADCRYADLDLKVHLRSAGSGKGD